MSDSASGDRSVRRPALGPGLALLAGMLLGLAASAGPARVLATALVAMPPAVTPLVPSRKRLAWLLAAVALVCGMLVSHRRVDTARALAVHDPRAQQGRHVHGQVVESPRLGPDGGMRFSIVAQSGIRWPHGGVVLAVRVAPSPPDAMAAVRRLLPGDGVRLWGRLRIDHPDLEADRWRRVAAAGLDGSISVKSARLIEPLARPRDSMARTVVSWREVARSRLDRAFGAAGSRRELAGALLMGDRASLQPELWRKLREAGLAHLVAISGLHVGILVALLAAVALRAGTGRRALAAIALVALPAFAVFVGVRASVARAALGAAVALGAAAIGRRGDGCNTLVLIAAAIAWNEPAALLAPGYQLTFLATVGIVTLARPVADRLPGPAPLRSGLAVSAAAYASTAPAAAWHFGFLAPVALLTNLVAAPLCAVVLLGGFCALILEPVPWLGGGAARIATAGLDGLLGVADLGSLPSAGAFSVARPAGWLVAAAYGLLVVVAVAADRRDGRHLSRGGMRLAAVLLGGCGIALHLGPPPSAPTEGRLALLDVGQGQALVAQAARGGTVVVDGGGSYLPSWDPGERVVLPFLLGRGCRRIDALFVTHEHLDHAGGVPALLRELEVGELWMGPAARRSPLGRRITDLAVRRGTAWRLAEAGKRTRAGGVPVEVLAPGRGVRFADPNHGSVVVRLRLGGPRVLIPGDLEAAGERALLAGGRDLSSAILVVPHHGSRNAAGDALLKAVNPQLALIAAGRNNRFGHPHPETLGRLRRRGLTIYRTDLEGTIALSTSDADGLARIIHETP